MNELQRQDRLKNERYQKAWEFILKSIEKNFGSRFNDAHLSKVDLPSDILEQVCRFAKKDRNILFFAGTPGIGKTYLCIAILKNYLEKFINPDVVNWGAYTERNLLSFLRQKINEGHDYSYDLKNIAEKDFLILDDLGSSRGTGATDWQKEIMFDLIDMRWGNRLPTVITSNIWIDELEKIYGERFVSRLKDSSNMIIQLQWHDKRITKDGTDTPQNTQG